MARFKEFVKEDVLDRAVNLFWCKGYNGTSMEEVVTCLGISRSSLYDTFGDKRQLFLQALNRYRQQMSGAMIAMVNQSEATLPTIKHLFAVAVQESLDSKLSKGCFIVNTTIELAAHDPEIARIVNANMQDVEDAFYQAVKRGQEKGELSTKHDARAVARFLFNNVSGIRVAAKSGADQTVYNDIVSVVMSILN